MRTGPETAPKGTPSKAGTWPESPASITGSRLGVALWPAFVSKIREWVRAECGPGRLLPWIPVAFGAGIALYFAADHEPVAVIVTPVAAVACAIAFLLRRRRAFPVAALVAALLSGFCAATLKTARVSHPVLLAPATAVSLKGFVETHEERERTDRFVLRVVSLDSQRQLPDLKRVRLSVRKGTAPAVGSFVELKAKLLPPLRPMRPGAYDFGRDMYFQGIGASGFVLGSVKVTTPPQDGGWRLRYSVMMQQMRDAVDARIRHVLSGDQRSIATALLTGRRDAISPPVNDAMFISGLGHVLSISGYHMAVVAGIVFFAVRALLALNPALAASYAIKKWAAAAALVAALFYLLLSGAEVATQRSFYMIAFVLVAVMVDRRAITFRTLALAAMLVLAIAPEALVHPSFQMSFAATLGLVALAQMALPRLLSGENSSGAVVVWGRRQFITLMTASVIAGLATTPYAAFHFHRITPYSVLANLAAMPVVSALVMPAGILGVLAMPFGLDGIFWRLMGIGIDWMIVVTQWVAALPGAVGRVAAFGSGPLIVMTMGIILLGLLRTPLRWSGAGVLILGVVWAMLTPRPDILISGDGGNVAVRSKDGRLRLMRTTRDAFLLREWLAGDADGRVITEASLNENVACDDAGCVMQGQYGDVIALTQKPDAFSDDCARAAVLVTALQPPSDCAALVIDRETLKRRGAMTLVKTASGYVIEANQPRGVDRPWSPASSEPEGEGEPPSTPRSTRTSPKLSADATPSDNDLQAED